MVVWVIPCILYRPKAAKVITTNGPSRIRCMGSHFNVNGISRNKSSWVSRFIEGHEATILCWVLRLFSRRMDQEK